MAGKIILVAPTTDELERRAALHADVEEHQPVQGTVRCYEVKDRQLWAVELEDCPR